MKYIVMLGTSLQTRGGIASVVQVYEQTGLFSRYPVRYVATHVDGGAAAKLRAMLQAYMTLLGLFLRGEVAVLHVHVASRASFWRKYGAFLLARLWSVRTILHLHGGGFADFYEKECGALRRWLIRSAYDHVDRVVVLSSQWERWVRGITRNRHVVALYNPVIVEPVQSDWARRDPASVLVLGRLNRNKGTYDLLQAIAALPATCAHARFRLGGDGEVEQARQAAARLGIGDRVELLGWVGPEEKRRHLDKAAIYALPSHKEGLPMSVLEAMAAGLPVVTTPVGGIPEAVTDGVEGFLVAPGDTVALGRALARLVNDPELARQMGAAGRRKVETVFASDIIMPQLERMYRELGAEPVEPVRPAGTVASRSVAPH